jgi:hypothetical protein
MMEACVTCPPPEGVEMAKSKFDKLAGKLANQPGVTNPKALAAAIGRKKYGAKTMAKASARGVSAASVAKGKSNKK